MSEVGENADPAVNVWSSASSPAVARCRRVTLLQCLAAMGRVAVRLREVVYTLGPHHQNVMSGLWKDLPYKLEKKVRENWVDALCLLVPVIGTYQLRRDGSARAACGYAVAFREAEKLHHRY